MINVLVVVLISSILADCLFGYSSGISFVQPTALHYGAFAGSCRPGSGNVGRMAAFQVIGHPAAPVDQHTKRHPHSLYRHPARSTYNVDNRIVNLYSVTLSTGTGRRSAWRWLSASDITILQSFDHWLSAPPHPDPGQQTP